MSSQTFQIPNISCNHCVKTIKMELNELDGVKQVEASAETKTVTLEWEAPQTWAGIKDLLKEINYPPVED